MAPEAVICELKMDKNYLHLRSLAEKKDYAAAISFLKATGQNKTGIFFTIHKADFLDRFYTDGAMSTFTNIYKLKEEYIHAMAGDGREFSIGKELPGNAIASAVETIKTLEKGIAFLGAIPEDELRNRDFGLYSSLCKLRTMRTARLCELSELEQEARQLDILSGNH